MAAALIVDVRTWADLRSSLLPSLSVVAAATLVRLNRGLPFNNADHFDLDEARSVVGSTVRNVKALRALILVVLLAMFWLALCPAFAPDLEKWVALRYASLPTDRLLSGSIAALLGYAAGRTVQVVQSDVGLAVLQGEIFERAIRRKAAKTFETVTAPTSQARIAGREGFGKPLH